MSWQPILNSKDAKKKAWKPVLKVSEDKRSQFGTVRPSNPLFTREGENPADSALFADRTPSTPRTTNFGTGDLAKALGQGVMQGFGASGAALKGLPEQARALATNTPVRKGSQSFTPTGKVQKAIYGTDKPISLETGGEIPGLIEKAQSFKPFGVEVPGVSNAMAVGAAFGVMDLTGAGGIRGLKGLSQALKVTEDVAEATSLLKKAGFAEDIAQQYAPLFAKEKNVKKIEEGLLSAEKLQNSTKVTAQKIQGVPEELQPLAQEAKKYKSAEDFVKAQTPIFRGSESVKTRAQGMTEGYTGVSFSRQREQAQKYGDMMLAKYVPENKILKPEDVPASTLRDLRKKFDSLDPDDADTIPTEKIISEVMEIAKKNDKAGADLAAFFPNMAEEAEVRLFGVNDSLTKSQLTDLWNKVNGGTDDVVKTGLREGQPPIGSEKKFGDLDTKTMYGAAGGLQPETDEQGNVVGVKFSPESAALGVLGVAGATKFKGAGKELTKEALSKLPPSTSAFRESIPKTTKVLKDALTNVVEYVQSTEERVRKLVSQKGMNLTVDPYQTMTLYHGRVGEKIEKGYNAVEGITDDVIDFVGRSRTDIDTGRAEISKYLQALHAPERNAALGEGAAGMTTAEARQIVANASPEIKAIAQKALDLHKQTLELLHDSGVITDELYTTLREKYKNHVPLQRVFEGDDIGESLSARGFDVRSTGIKTAKGSEREVADILTNIVNNYEQAVIRSEKNIVDNATLAFVRNNEDALKGLITIRKPRAIGQRLGGGIKETVDELTGNIGQDIRGTTSDVDSALAQAEMEVLTQLDLSQAGYRNIVDYGIDRTVDAVPSTFPKWVPEHLREKKLFTKVVDIYNSGKIPRGNASKEKELLELVQEQIANRVPLDVRDEIALTELAKSSEVRASLTKKIVGKEAPLILEQTNDPKILQMFENGKRTWIEFKDERLATAFRGVGREKLGAFMQGVGAFTRFYAGLMTRFNYEFALPNKIRDLQETITYMASQKDVGFKGAASVLTKDVSSIRDIAFSLAKPDSKYAKMYQEMKSLGGTTGGLGLSTRKQTELNIDKIFANARSRPRKALSKLVEYVDNWNTIFEDSTRLSVYKAALDRGLTKERAAFLAKEASINFNRMGKGGPLINALYMFANASIQGSVKMLRAMKDPKVAAGVFTAVGASVAAVSEWNDTVDPEWRDKVTEWDRDGGLPILLPTEDGSTAYFTIPVSWGIKPILVMSNAMYDAVSGQEVDATHAAGKIFSSFIDAYNPVGGSDIVSSLTPTAIDVPTEISRNESWSGAKIRPDFNRNLPRDLQYFDSLDDTVQGRASIAVTNQLRESTGLLVSPADLNYVIDQYIGGAGRSVKKINETLYGLTTGDMPPADEWPMVSRFLRLRTEEETGQGAGGAIDKIRSALSEQEREKFELKNEAIDTFEELSALPKDVAAERFNFLQQGNPELAKKVVEIANDKKLGLNYTERLIKQLNVQNGERAAYIAGYLQTLGSKEEKAKAWENFVSKKILTPEVAKQVTELLNK